MTEIEQLRKEISELRGRLACLERREKQLEDISYREFRQMRSDWIAQNPFPQPMFVQEIAKHFAPGTVLC